MLCYMAQIVYPPRFSISRDTLYRKASMIHLHVYEARREFSAGTVSSAWF